MNGVGCVRCRRRIVVSVHDVTPRHFDRLARIERFLRDAGLAGRYAMLVVPDFWRQWPIADHPRFQQWLRSRAAEGVEMILHGYHHLDETPHPHAAARWKARLATAGEAEFLGLDAAEATARLRRGKDEIESILGTPVEGFIAPAWLCGKGAASAMREGGFRYTEDHWGVWCPSTGRMLARSPVVSYASRSRARMEASLLWSAASRVALARAPVVRLAIHPADFGHERLVRAIDRTLRGFLAAREPCLYRDLLTAA